MKDEFLLADLKLEVYQEWVLLVKHLKKSMKIHHSFLVAYKTDKFYASTFHIEERR